MHKWHFFKTARLTQVALEKGADLDCLAELDQKLWTVLSLPASGIRFDARTLAFLDTDHDGRIRAPELLAALDWLKPRLKSRDLLFNPPAGMSLPLDAIDDGTEEGRALLKALREILSQNGREEAASIALDDVVSIDKVFSGTPFNGDGVVTELSTSDASVAAAIQAVAAVSGTVRDRSGKDGIDQAGIDAFFTNATAWLAWRDQGEKDPAVCFLGKETAAAEAELAAVEEKIDAYFTPPSDLPLVTDAPDPALPLLAGLHPLWLDKFRTFAVAAAAPALGVAEVSTLTRGQWAAVKAKFAPYRAWRAAEPAAVGAAVEQETLRTWLADGKMKAALDELIVKDLALAGASARLEDAERVIRYTAHLAEILFNTVNQACLYNPETAAVYQTGTLYIDARACSLCFHVTDEAAHAALAAKSKCCLVYARLTRPGATPWTVCAVVTAGRAAPLFVGRHGLFYDRDGKDWDAVVTRIAEAPISLREAFWSPWVKLFDTVAAQAGKFLAARRDTASAQAGAAVSAPAAGNGAAFASAVAALGIGVGMAGAACAGLIGLIAGLPLWKVATGAAAVILAVSLPSVIIAWFKLRARDLGAVLNAGGWAVNRPLYFTSALARLFTRPAALPACAAVARNPYVPCPALRKILMVVLMATALLAVLIWVVWGNLFPKKAYAPAGLIVPAQECVK